MGDIGENVITPSYSELKLTSFIVQIFTMPFYIPGAKFPEMETSVIPVHTVKIIRHRGSIIMMKKFFSYFFLAVLCNGMWDLNSPTRDQICAPCIGSMES